MQPEFDQIPLDALHFDPLNPRFPTYVDGSDEAAILEFMLEDAGLPDLMRSIASQGFFPGEPLLVCPRTESGWSVIEGNRRLAASKLLADPGLAPTKRKTVADIAGSASEVPGALPCLKFSKRGDILVHLGYRHVTGIKEWEPLAKARFLRQRFDELSGSSVERFRTLARSIGSRSDYVGRLLASLAIYDYAADREFFNIPGLSEESVDFSLISSVLAYADIVDFLGMSSSQDLEISRIVESRLQHLFRWVFERDDRRKTVLGESRNIKVLAEVVSNDRARDALEGGVSLQAASELIGGAQEFLVYIDDARQSLSLAREQVATLNVDERAANATDEVRNIAVELSRAVHERMTGED